MARRTIPYLLGASLRAGVGVDYTRFPFDIPAIRDIGEIAFHPNVTFFVGENGTGKSTLLEAVARGVGLRVNGHPSAPPFDGEGRLAALHEALRVTRGVPKPRDACFLRPESFFDLVGDDDDAPLGERWGGRERRAQSRGEAFMHVLLNRLTGDGLYLLDEPEAALSPNRQLGALRAIHQLVENHSQFVIATHSPILLAYPFARIYQFDRSGVREVAFEDTEHYTVTRDFLDHVPRRLEQLLRED